MVRQKIKMYIPLTIIILIATFGCLYFYQKTNKKTYIDKKSSNYLKELKIENHNIDFDPLKDYYEITVDDSETSLSIIAEPLDKSAKVKIFNNDDLTKHNQIYIYVTSKDHDIHKYTISYNNETAERYFKNNIDDCTNINSEYCFKFFNLKNKDKDNFLFFSYDSLTTSGYPKTNIININNKQIFKKKLIDGEFRNFNIIDDKIIFTYNNKKDKNKIYLYGVDLNGNIVLNKTIVNQNYKNLYTYAIKISSQKLKLKTKITNLTKQYVCKIKNNDVIEARYDINYKNKQFEEPILTSKLSALEYKILMNIKC